MLYPWKRHLRRRVVLTSKSSASLPLCSDARPSRRSRRHRGDCRPEFGALPTRGVSLAGDSRDPGCQRTDSDPGGHDVTLGEMPRFTREHGAPLRKQGRRHEFWRSPDTGGSTTVPSCHGWLDLNHGLSHAPRRARCATRGNPRGRSDSLPHAEE
jgi:hypothetical protein